MIQMVQLQILHLILRLRARIPCLARELNLTLSLEKINGLTLCKVYQVPPSAKAKGHAREKGKREGAYNAYSFIAP